MDESCPVELSAPLFSEVMVWSRLFRSILFFLLQNLLVGALSLSQSDVQCYLNIVLIISLFKVFSTFLLHFQCQWTVTFLICQTGFNFPQEWQD